MKLPIIKHLAQSNFIPDSYEEAVDVLIAYCEARGVKEEELDVIGELISNLEGTKIVINEHRHYGVPLKEALNKFMQRVINSIK